MTTLSIEHAKHIVRMRHKDAYMNHWQDAIYASEKDYGGKSNVKLGTDWINAALLILADPEFWLGDERVVKACWPETHMYGDGRVWSDGTAAIFLGKWWKAARQHESVQSFEQQYRPKGDRASGMPTGSDPKDFCECDHHEMNHANYSGMTRACNQTGCGCQNYRPKDEKPMSDWVLNKIIQDVAELPDRDSPEDLPDPKTGYTFAEYVAMKMNGELDHDTIAQSMPLPVEIPEDAATDTMCEGCGELIHLVEGEWKRVGREDKQSYCRGSLTQGPYPHRPVSWDAGVEDGKLDVPEDKNDWTDEHWAIYKRARVGMTFAYDADNVAHDKYDHQLLRLQLKLEAALQINKLNVKER